MIEAFRLHVPAGIAQREVENAEIEQEGLEYDTNTLINKMGHSFVFNLPLYIQFLSKISQEFRRYAKDAVRQFQVLSSRGPPEACDHFNVSYDESSASFAWQYELDDAHLCALLDLFRVIAKVMLK